MFSASTSTVQPCQILQVWLQIQILGHTLVSVVVLLWFGHQFNWWWKFYGYPYHFWEWGILLGDVQSCSGVSTSLGGFSCVQCLVLLILSPSCSVSFSIHLFKVQSFYYVVGRVKFVWFRLCRFFHLTNLGLIFLSLHSWRNEMSCWHLSIFT